MDTQKLVSAGLTAQQATAYALLIEFGSLTPPVAAQLLKLSRTNAYKLLDKLVDLDVAIKKDVNKKIAYLPNNPMALVNMVAAERNTITAREFAVRSIISDLLEKYYGHTENPLVSLASGKSAVAEAYRAQISLDQDIYFIRSHADISSMGFDTMVDLRTTPERHGHKRYAIHPDLTKGSINQSKLTRTWVRQEDYDAPVEWSVSGSSLLIVLFGEEPHAISIINPIIAQAFMQIWKLLDSTLRSMPYYHSLPRTND